MSAYFRTCFSSNKTFWLYRLVCLSLLYTACETRHIGLKYETVTDVERQKNEISCSLDESRIIQYVHQKDWRKRSNLQRAGWNHRELSWPGKNEGAASDDLRLNALCYSSRLHRWSLWEQASWVETNRVTGGYWSQLYWRGKTKKLREVLSK
jgi:hypothetical protein